MLKTSYTVQYTNGRALDVVYTTAAVRRVAGNDPIASVTENQVRWYGSHEDGTRHFRTLNTRELSSGEY